MKVIVKTNRGYGFVYTEMTLPEFIQYKNSNSGEDPKWEIHRYILSDITEDTITIYDDWTTTF